MKTMIGLGLALAVMGGAAAHAQWQIDEVNLREEKVERRIDQGVKQGTLTGAEAQQLRNEWRSILQLEADYRKSGGGISDLERRDLMNQLADLYDEIEGQKTNGVFRP